MALLMWDWNWLRSWTGSEMTDDLVEYIVGVCIMVAGSFIFYSWVLC